MILTTLAALTLALPPEPGADDIVQKAFKDATFVVRVEKGDQAELSKISRDFGASYRFRVVTAYVKEPLKMRLETSVDDTQITYIIVDDVRHFRIPRAKINSSEDLKDKPGKMQTPLDYGIITPAVIDRLFTAKFIRTERGTGEYVFDLTYQRPRFSDTSRHRIWVDPKKRIVTRRDWFGQDGRQMGTFFYEEAKHQGGVWFPSRGIVRNMDGKVAGIVEYEKVKVNTNLPDSLFKP
jgi:outer membrane lipoprotein-sorting protein